MTQHEKIYNYIQKNGSITTLEAAIALRITKLPTRIGEMRRNGLNIVGVDESHKNEFGEVSHYKRYFFEKVAQNP